MKQGSSSEKRPDSKSDGEPIDEDEGIDAFRVLQVVAVTACLILIIWFILHNVLHII
ncbi:hypothetical protein [Methanoregula sp.]|uniref:hypothetical protein n=1 Tax=Methanoregula sp. TaxID=2052170 RepID=UPI0025EC737A|nr:hypothetical protein [Methanoregula sp.]